MSLLPRSLYGRLALILFFGLLLAQLLGALIQFRDRGQRLFLASGLSSAERIAQIVRLLDSTGPAERRRLVKILNVPPLQISLDTPAWPMSRQKMQSHSAFAFRRRLAAQLGRRYQLRVLVSDQPVTEPVHPMHGAGPHTMQHMQGMGMIPPEALVFLAQVRLGDGSIVTFKNRIATEIFADSSRLLVTLVVLLVAVLVLSLLAVRWVTRPLTMLAHAADRLGADINQPALKVTGPSEVRHAINAFNSMQARLRRYLEDRARLLTAISHDLKTPITRMRLSAEMLEDPQQRERFIRNLDAMQSIATETLDFLHADDSTEALQSVDLCALLEAIVEDAAELGQQVEMEPCTLRCCRVRPVALKRCISNLVDNALKYGSDVRLHAEKTPSGLKIAVLDSGPGIPEHELEAVFEPFYRLETSRSRKTGGTGLGLSIARSIALSHGGDLTLYNRREGGLAAVLTLRCED